MRYAATVMYLNKHACRPCMQFEVQSNLGYPNADYPKLLGYSKTISPEFFLYYLLQ